MSDNAKVRLAKRRKERVRYSLRKDNGRLRMSVFRSGRHISVQIIDDIKRVTLISASTLESTFKSTNNSNMLAAEEIGKLIAKRAKDIGCIKIFFDRSSYKYHGRVKALAEAARKGGLVF